MHFLPWYVTCYCNTNLYLVHNRPGFWELLSPAEAAGSFTRVRNQPFQLLNSCATPKSAAFLLTPSPYTFPLFLLYSVLSFLSPCKAEVNSDSSNADYSRKEHKYIPCVKDDFFFTLPRHCYREVKSVKSFFFFFFPSPPKLKKAFLSSYPFNHLV